MNNNPKKRKIMKRIIQTAVVALVCLVAFQLNAVADNDKPINVTQLPATAQQVLKKYFPSKKWHWQSRRQACSTRLTT